MRDLGELIPPDQGWLLIGAFGINSRGQIVGVGLVRGTIRGFLLTPSGGRE